MIRRTYAIVLSAALSLPSPVSAQKAPAQDCLPEIKAAASEHSSAKQPPRPDCSGAACFAQGAKLPHASLYLKGAADATVRNAVNYRQRKPAHTAIFAVVPGDVQGFESVFPEEVPTAGNLEQARAGRDALTLAGAEFGDHGGAVDFTRFLAATHQQVVLVVGHNDEGMFRFTKGPAVSLRELANSCLRAAKRCVFLSCNSAQHLAGQATGIGSELTYVEAAEAASFISAKLDVLSSADYATLLRAVDDSMRALQKRRNVRVMLRIGKGGVIVAVVIGAYCWEDGHACA
ncbi:MAG TPA: hypothetical protein VNN80_03950 [Polyangiaceae bacterium]|nr:hypothetical protein [Polyangiaceae bacterium]